MAVILRQCRPLAGLCLLLLSLACWSAAASAAAVPVRVVRFGDLQPAGAGIKNTFGSLGFDADQRVYVALCNPQVVANVGNCFLFRWDPKTGARKYFDNFLAAAKRADNLGPNAYWNKPETLVKGHTHIWYMKGQMWLGTMNAHGYNDPSKVRGMHLMALNLATGKLVDHSKGQPGGVFHAGGGTYTLAVVPANDLVLSVGVPDCTIIAYNPATGATARTAGVPHENATDPSDPLTNGNSAGRDMVVLAGDKVLYQCGSGATPFALYDIKTRTTEQLPFTVGNPLSRSYAVTADGMSAYVSDDVGIYKFSLATKTGRLVAALDPVGGRNQTSAVNLSRDGRKLYYVINQATRADGTYHGYVDDLYEYNLVTGTRTKLMNLKAAIGGGAKFSGSHMIGANGKLYLGFHGAVAPGIVEIDVSGR